MKILLIGGGGREHAIAEGIKKSKHNPSLYALMAKKIPELPPFVRIFSLRRKPKLRKSLSMQKPEISKLPL